MATSTQSLQPVDNVIVPHPVTLELYRKMLTVYYVEERMKAFVRQGKCGFQASTRGHEKLQIGMTMLLKPGHDWFFTYYRSKAVAVGLGMPIKDIFLGMLGREGDPNSNGRNMPEQWSSRKLRLVSQTAVTGTQYLNAVGMARAIKMNGGDEIVHVSSGEGATSEGEFFEALNWASREKLPVLFTVQNNGYAISVPQASQTGSEVHRIAQGFGMPAFHLDGTWFEQTLRNAAASDRRDAARGGTCSAGSESGAARPPLLFRRPAQVSWRSRVAGDHWPGSDPPDRTLPVAQRCRNRRRSRLAARGAQSRGGSCRGRSGPLSAAR